MIIKNYMKNRRGGRLAILALVFCAMTFGCIGHTVTIDESNRIEELFLKQLRKSYEEANKDVPGGICQYSLLDLNNDSVPELFVETGSCEADFSLTVYEVRRNRLRKILNTYVGHSSLFVGKDCVIKDEAQAGIYRSSKIAMQNGRLKETVLFSGSFFEMEEEIDTLTDSESGIQTDSDSCMIFFSFENNKQSEHTLRENLLRYHK